MFINKCYKNYRQKSAINHFDKIELSNSNFKMESEFIEGQPNNFLIICEA